ncbi:MAG: hypothetical protein MZW92_46595 [Comamonadaceae bacterium]|nr:hypothetical protein [Comamonadaceae bacterium]
MRLQETVGVAGRQGREVRVHRRLRSIWPRPLENVTYAPRLNAAPFAGGDGTDSARASLAAFVNGQTGAANPQRQGLNSAMLDGLDPLNVLAWTSVPGPLQPAVGRAPPRPGARRPSPPAATRGSSISGKVTNLAQKGLVTAPDGSAFGPARFIVNCPIVSSD